MNAIMNEKGRQTKLLAAIAIIAMVVCVFAVIMPSDNVDAYDSSDVVDGSVKVSDFAGLQQALADDTVDTIVFEDDITATAQITINKDVNLGNHTLTTYGSGDPYYVEETVKISNGTIDTGSNKGGTMLTGSNVTFENVTFVGTGMLLRTGAAETITINGCTFGTEGVTSSSGIYNNNSACMISVDADTTFAGEFSEGAISVEYATPTISA